MHIEVIYKDYRVEMVEADLLDEMIAAGSIIAFRRSSGLVLVGMDPVRESNLPFAGPGRRKGDGTPTTH